MAASTTVILPIKMDVMFSGGANGIAKDQMGIRLSADGNAVIITKGSNDEFSRNGNWFIIGI